MNKNRVFLVWGLMVIAAGVLITNLVRIQVVKHQYYSEIASRQHEEEYRISAERGKIIDADGNILSYTKDDYSIYIYNRLTSDSTKMLRAATYLSRISGEKRSTVIAKLKKISQRTLLYSKISREKFQNLKDSLSDGIEILPNYSRVYPFEKISSHVLGFVDGEMKGVNGVEFEYDQFLKGKEGFVYRYKNGLGKTVTIDDKVSYAPERGNDVVLTLKKSYQQILEEELSNGVTKYEAKSGSAIIMDPQTGAILALANFPDYHPSRILKDEEENRRNRVLTDPIEPGSTIKGIVLASLLQEELVKLTEAIDTENGTFSFKGVKITDTKGHKFLKVPEILQESSNIAMVKLSTRIDDEKFFTYLRDFGFGNPTSVDLPGESAGLLKKPGEFRGVSKAFISQGYEISVTPIQMAAAFSALINGGILYKPYIVKEVRDDRGNLIKNNTPEKIRQPIDPEISEEVKHLLMNVVEKGTGMHARLNNMQVGGKTGTAQKIIKGKYTSKEYYASFAGFFPVNDPKLMIYIVLDAPQVGRYGSQTAAPVFRETAKRIIDLDPAIVPQKKEGAIESIIRDNKIVEMTENSYDETDHEYSNIEENQPEENQPLKEPLVIKQGIMPDLTNLSIKNVFGILSRLGIKFKIEGNGRVVAQSIPPGTVLTRNTFCKVECKRVKRDEVNR